MKIGIITLPLHHNIGGLLQAWALQNTLTKLGHDVEIIDQKPIVGSWLKEIVRFCIQAARKIVGSKKTILFPYIIKMQYTNKFTHRKIHFRGSRNFDQIKQNDYDTFVVGSDQIWRPDYAGKSLYSAYLDFAKDWNNIKRIAYATSFGVEEWKYTEEQTNKCSELAKRFDLITVREDSGVTLCREHLKIEAKHVVDPTMLMTIEDYSYLIDEDANTYAGSELFCYVLDETPEIKHLITNVERDGNFSKTQVIEGTFKWKNIFKKNVCQYPTVTQWLRCFRDAKCIITDSFHGTVFSIIFNKPFVVLHNEGRGNARMESLVRSFDIEERLVNANEKDQVLKLLRTQLNTEDKLLRLREFGLETLKKINKRTTQTL